MIAVEMAVTLWIAWLGSAEVIVITLVQDIAQAGQMQVASSISNTYQIIPDPFVRCAARNMM